MNRIKLKYLTESTFLYGANESAMSENISEPRYIRITDIKSNGELKPETFKSLSYEKAKPYLLSSGDILFARTGATVGKAYIHEQDSLACFAGYLIRFRANTNKLLPKLLFYYTRTLEYQNWIESNTIQATIQNVSAEKYKELKIPIYSITEQKLIVSYLNSKISEINKLISSKEKQIQLLEEQRQSMITEAMTKGLNSDVEMKNSGVGWIGKIPKNWKIKKMKLLTSLLTCGYASTPKYVSKDEGVPFLSAQNVSKDGKLKLDKFNYISKDLHNKLARNKTVESGDLLQVRVGAGIGQTCVVNVDFNFSIYVSLSHIRTTSEINNQYLAYILNTDIFKEYMLNITTQAGGVGNLNVTDLEKVKLPVPPLKEQTRIVKNIKEIEKYLLSIKSKQQVQISKLNEYCQSLIHEAITGKIPVEEMEKYLREVEKDGN